MITIGTDCSGIDAPIQALKQLKIPYIQEWYCDIDKYARQTAEANYPVPKKYIQICLQERIKSFHVLIFMYAGSPVKHFH
jgi:site-specific DNA-cytosine methylase